MSQSAPFMKPVSEAVTEPLLSDAQRRDYEEGWQLFVSGHYWHAHEAWERLWRPFEGPARAFVQGLIQLTAACHLLQQPGRREGGLKNLDKAEDKLRHFALGRDVTRMGRFLDVDVKTMLEGMAAIREVVRGDAARGAQLESELSRLGKSFALATVDDAEDQPQQ